MKKTFLKAVLSLPITAVIIAVAFVLNGVYGTRHDPVESAGYGAACGFESAVAVFAPSPEPAGDTFTIRETDGKIGIFVGAGETPLYVLDIFVYTLPDSVKELLAGGIECSGDELTAIFDAFTS